MIGDSTYDTLDCYEYLLAAGVVLAALYNPRTLTIRSISNMVEDCIEKHSEDAQLKQSV